MTNESPLWALANEIRGVIVRWLLEHEGKQFYGRFKKVDLLRLTRLEVWSWRHKVSVEEILTLTLPYLRKTLTAAQKTRYGLGCTVAALTGSGNEKILINALAQVYHGNEHRGIWRRSEQRRQMEAERAEETDGLPIREKKFKGIMEAESVEAFVQAYNNRALRARASLNNELRSAKRKRKHYRFNPWL